MTLQVFTARIGHVDPSVLDITRKSGCRLGKVFAPSWSILRPALNARSNAEMLRTMGKADAARDVEDAAWAAYVPAFVAEMRESYRRERDSWNMLLAREKVCLVCYCSWESSGADAAGEIRCHRRLLAHVLGKLGAEVHDEPMPGGLSELHRAQLDTVIEALEIGIHAVEDQQAQDDDVLGYPDQLWLNQSLDAFRSMRERGYPLSEKQTAWIEKIADHSNITIPRAPVLRGREVAMLFKPGPTAPPGRRSAM